MSPQESPIDPGEGFRLLVDGDLITDKAQVWACGEGPWAMAGFQGEGHDAALMHPMREPIKAPQATESTSPAMAICSGLGKTGPDFEKWWNEIRLPGYLPGADYDTLSAAKLAAQAAWAAATAVGAQRESDLEAELEELETAGGDMQNERDALRSSLTQARQALQLGRDAIFGSLQPHCSIGLDEIKGILASMDAALDNAQDSYRVINLAKAIMASLDGKALEVGK